MNETIRNLREEGCFYTWLHRHGRDPNTRRISLDHDQLMTENHLSMYVYEFLFPNAIPDDNDSFFATCNHQCKDIPINLFCGIAALVFLLLGVIFSDHPSSNIFLALGFVSFILKQAMFILTFDIGVIKLSIEQDASQHIFLALNFLLFSICLCIMFDKTVFLRVLLMLALLISYPSIVFVDANTMQLYKVQMSYKLYILIAIGVFSFLVFGDIDDNGFKSDPLPLDGSEWKFYPLIVARYCLLTLIFWMCVYGYILHKSSGDNHFRRHVLVTVRTRRRILDIPQSAA